MTFGEGGLRTIDSFGPSADTLAEVALSTGQPDGKILVAGTVTSQGFTFFEQNFGVVRYDADGTLDQSFGTSGRVVTRRITRDTVEGLALQDDGKIVVVGNSRLSSSLDFDITVVRYNGDGSLDTTFGVDGLVTTDLGLTDSGNAVVIQEDGKIVVAGQSDGDFALVRYHPNGALDTDFGTAGRVVTDLGGSDRIEAVAIHEGMIVVAGLGGGSLALARYDLAGNPDDSFDGDGMVTTTGLPLARDLLIDDSGRLVTVGGPALARFTSAGTFDSTFGVGGIATLGYAANSVALQGDGSLLALGTLLESGSFNFALTRYTSAGELDGTFSGGLVTTDFGGTDSGIGVALQADGKVVVAGSAFQSDSLLDFALARYNADGTLDGGFGEGGKVLTNVGSRQDDFGGDVALQADGKIVMVGGSNGDFAVTRLHPDGSVDTTFGEEGRATTRFFFSDSNEVATSVLIQDDGKILVVGGLTTGDFRRFLWAGLVRFNSDGTPDTSFGDHAGRVLTGLGSPLPLLSFLPDVYEARIAADGKISLIAGTTDGLVQVRYNPNGTLDDTFGTSGIARTPFPVGNLRTAAFAPDGRIVAAGTVFNDGQDDLVVARFHGDNTPDTTFSGDGVEVTDFNGLTEEPSALAVQADGSIVIVGHHAGDLLVVRYQENGDLDKGFGKQGRVTADLGGFEEASAVVIQPNGKIVVAGWIQNAVAPFGIDFVVARFTADGSPDTGFSGGTVLTDFGSTDQPAGIALQADGKILVLGTTRLNTGDSAFALARYEGVSNADQAITRIVELIRGVQSLVQQGILNQGQGNALLAKLENAIQQIDNGKNLPAINKLGAFINLVNDLLAEGTLTTEQGQPLIDGAIEAIRFLAEEEGIDNVNDLLLALLHGE